MPSPTCLVKDGDGAYVSTVDGVDVGHAHTITIKLEDSAGVDSWSIQCIGSDELVDSAAITASLVVDGVQKTATFTSIDGVAALVFRSTVTNRIGITASTTFGIYTPSSQGFRVSAVNETTEGSAAYGWIKQFNQAIRAIDDLVSGSAGGSGAPSFVPFSGAKLDGGALDPTWEIYKTPVKAYSFDPAATNALHLQFVAPSNASSGLIPQLHWAPSTGAAGVVRWQIDVTVANTDTVFPTASTLVVDEASPAVADKKKVTQFTSLNGVTANAIINMRIARIGGDSHDTYTDKVWGMGIGLGIGMYTAPSPVSPQFVEIDFTPQASSYTGTTITRSGASIYVQTGPSTLTSIGNNIAVWEDRQDGSGGGIWLGASWTNEITQPHDLSDAYWNKLNSPTVVGPSGTPGLGPDGSTQMSSVEDTGANERVVYKTGFSESPTGFPKIFMSAWTKVLTAPSVGQGLMGLAYSATSLTDPYQRLCAIKLGSSTSLHRVCAHDQGYGVGNIYFGVGGYAGGNSSDSTTGALDRTGVTAPVTNDALATGKSLIGFVQVQRGGADLPYAVPGSGTGNVVCALDTSVLTGKLVDSGDLDVEVEFIAGQDGYDRRSGAEPVVFDGRLWSGTSTDGEMSLRHVQGTGGEDQALILRVRGVDVLTKTTTAIPDGYFSWRKGDRVTIRAWYRVSNGTCGIRYQVNNTQWWTEKTGSTTGGALAVATVAHIGSLSGTSQFWPQRYTKWRVYVQGSPPTTPQPQIVYHGDSTSAPYQRMGVTLAKVLRPTDTKTGMSCAVSGHRVQDQLTRWNAIVDKSQIQAVVINVGFNNIGPDAEDAATVLGRVQTLINQIKSDRPTAKIVVCKLHPAKSWFGGAGSRYDNWVAFNAGVPGLSSIDAVVSGHVAVVNDGADSLAAVYGLDTVHGNDFERQVEGDYIRQALVSISVLP